MRQISVIVAIFNESLNISSFLRSYGQQTVFANEVILVDGGSTDDTVDKIEEYSSLFPEQNIRCIVDPLCNKSHSRGPIARARNLAIRESSGDIIVVTDAGCLLANDWLEKLLLVYDNDPSIDVVGGWYEANVENEFQDKYQRAFMPSLDTINANHYLPSSRNIAFRRRCWEEIGGYPELTYTAEDTVFGLRLKSAGYKFQFQKDAIVYWSCPKNPAETLRKMSSYAYGDGQYRNFTALYLARLLLLLIPLDIIFRKKLTGLRCLAYRVNLARTTSYWSAFLFAFVGRYNCQP